MRKKQLSFNLSRGTWGGRREGSGRKRLHSQGVAHRTREKVTHRTPLHINFKYRTFIKNKKCLKLLKRAVVNARRNGLRVLHFSMQTNHLHFIIEADSNEGLTKGMRSLAITFAKGLKKGRVQLERYHLHVFKTIRETRNAIQYVLFNQQKHDSGTCSTIDGYSSVLTLKNALEVIKNFVKKQRMTLKIGGADPWSMDEGRSYLFRSGISQLNHEWH